MVLVKSRVFQQADNRSNIEIVDLRRKDFEGGSNAGVWR